MSNKEFLEVLDQFLSERGGDAESLATFVEKVVGNLDLVDRAEVEDIVSDVIENHDFGDEVETYLDNNTDFLTQDDLESYGFVQESDIDTCCDDWAYWNLDDKIEEFLDENFQGYFVAQYENYTSKLFKRVEMLEDLTLGLVEKIDKLEGRLAMVEAIEILESVKKC